MSSNQSGMFIPNRVIFIMVGVSVCINLFFLLMGILIGKDDLKWERTKTPEVVEVQDDATPRTQLDRELSVFEPDTTRDQPLDVTYQGAEDKPVDPIVTQPAAEPNAVAAKSDPIETPVTDTEGGFWIQVLASKDRQQAEEFRKRVRAKGYAVVVLSEGGYFKVQVGPYPARGKAEQDKSAINQFFKVNGWIRAK